MPQLEDTLFIRTRYSDFYYIVYKTTNHINGKIYIGRKLTKNLNDGYLGSGNHFKRALNKYGQDNFYREILEFCQDRKQLSEREIWWIAELDARNPIIGYNIGRGGEGSNLEHFTEEHKKHLRESHKGKHIGHPGWSKGLTKETDVRLQQTSIKLKGKVGPRLGAITSEKTKQLQRKKALGRHWSSKRKEIYYKRPMVTCPHCGFVSRNQMTLTKLHFDNCKMNSNRIVTAEILEKKKNYSMYVKKRLLNLPMETCPCCGLQGRGGAMKQWHFDNCRHVQKIA
jgi:group I intron endonuclease